MNSLMSDLLHAVGGDDRGGDGGCRVDGAVVDGVEGDRAAVSSVEVDRGEVEDGAAHGDGAQEQNH